MRKGMSDTLLNWLHVLRYPGFDWHTRNRGQMRLPLALPFVWFSKINPPVPFLHYVRAIKPTSEQMLAISKPSCPAEY